MNSRRNAQRIGGTDALEGIVEPEDLFAYLREGLRFAREVLELTDRLAQGYPRVVWQRLLDGERVAMRAAEAEFAWETLNEHSHRTVCLKVFSGAWTGKQVEEELLRLTTARYLNADAAPVAPTSLALNVRFDFVSEEEARATWLDDEPVRAPYVVVVAPIPLPPSGVIAREYEALVRADRGWHLELPGSVSRQEKVVAVRTWVIGLLVSDGMPVHDAIDAVHQHLGLGDISQSCFGSDRRNLLDRVPEANSYIYAPTGGSERDTRAERRRPLVPSDLTPLPAQPEPMPEDLFP